MLDLGAYIGYYSFLAAKSGHYAIAVEPVSNHVGRLYTGVRMNGLEEAVAVLVNAVADERMVASVHRSGHNQGDSQVEMQACNVLRYSKNCIVQIKYCLKTLC